MKPSLINKFLLAIALIYTIALLTVSLIKINTASMAISFNNADKVFHFGAYCGMAVLWMAYTVMRDGVFSSKTAFWVCLLVVLFGIIIEVLQGTLTDYRGFEYLDMVADFSGALLAFVLFIVVKRRFAGNSKKL